MPRTAPPYDKATINLIGPKSGYTPQVGTIVTMLTWMEPAVLGPTRGLTQQDLDFLFDKNANTIGALMLHLAATEVLYQRMTFNNENFDKFPADYAAKWGPAMNLGDAARSSIKGPRHRLLSGLDPRSSRKRRSPSSLSAMTPG